MKNKDKKTIVGLLIAPIWLLAMATFLLITVYVYESWKEKIEYYWYTDVFKLYESRSELRLCGGEVVKVFWLADDTDDWFERVREPIKEGAPATFVVRGVILKEESEVRVLEIHKVDLGLNAECL